MEASPYTPAITILPVGIAFIKLVIALTSEVTPRLRTRNLPELSTAVPAEFKTTIYKPQPLPAKTYT